MNTIIRKFNIKLLACVLFCLSAASCKKFLEATPDKSLVIPSTLTDLQALLDNTLNINRFNMGLGEASSDNYFIINSSFNALSQGDQNTFLWGDELVFNNTNNEWYFLYQPVYYANVVLENLDKIERTEANKADWDNLKGEALFIRARSFHILVTTFAKAYDTSTSGTDLGIPLRLTSDFNIASVRATVANSYNQIISDLNTAKSLLPISPVTVMRASKTAAYGLLSRVYLSMRNYPPAGAYADSCLQLKSDLMNYNGGTGVSPTASFPFVRFNPEVIFHASGTLTPLSTANARIDTILYASYATNDLRRTLYFKSAGSGYFSFKGGYFGTSQLFYGLATDEFYLTKAECLARNNDVTGALTVLNSLLIKRWKTNTFVPVTATSQADALNKILVERRKELLFRDLRWMDIKRLNKEGANITLQRLTNGKLYNLAPNENRYALPIPATVIQLSGIPQNPR